MTARCFTICSAVFLCIVWFAVPADCETRPECQALRQELQIKQEQLNSYLEALGKKGNREDPLLQNVLNYNIEQLILAMSVLEKRIKDCDVSESGSESGGMSSVKSEESKFATKTCGDLRRMLVQHVRKENAFKRRENSFLADLTPAEKTEYRETVQDLETIRTILKNRCTASPPKDSLKRRLR